MASESTTEATKLLKCVGREREIRLGRACDLTGWKLGERLLDYRMLLAFNESFTVFQRCRSRAVCDRARLVRRSSCEAFASTAQGAAVLSFGPARSLLVIVHHAAIWILLLSRVLFLFLSHGKRPSGREESGSSPPSVFQPRSGHALDPNGRCECCIPERRDSLVSSWA